jgi:Rrf2 family protein
VRESRRAGLGEGGLRAPRGGELAAAASGGPQKGERIAQDQKIPLKFLENVLLDLKHSGLVQSQRGAEGGYWLAWPPEEITLADLAAGRLPDEVAEIASDPEAWLPH